MTLIKQLYREINFTDIDIRSSKTDGANVDSFSNFYNSINEAQGDTYYHGTKREFGNFEIGSQKENRASNITGIYFTPRKNEAEEYGNRVISAKLHYNKLFNGQQANHINDAMQEKAFDLLSTKTTYRPDWLRSAIIPDFVEKGVFSGGLMDVDGDIKREILLAGGYDAYKDGEHIAMLNTDGIEVIQ